MLCGIIDIGSNTIRLSIYKYENGGIKHLLHKKTMAGLVSYIEKRRMSDKGTAVACEILNGYLDIVKNFGIEENRIFATAPLRNIKNTDEVLRVIKEETGMEVDVLSGEEEALLGCFGAFQDGGIEKGIIVDIGGGSTEISFYDGSRIIWACSIPVGSLNLYREYVDSLLPVHNEKKKIEKRVREELKKQEVPKTEVKELCGIGGTVRAVTALSNLMFDKPKQNTKLPVSNIHALYKLYEMTPDYFIEKVLRRVPDRVHTVLPGLLVLKTIAEYFGCRQVWMSGSGVREGYFYEKVLQRISHEK